MVVSKFLLILCCLLQHVAAVLHVMVFLLLLLLLLLTRRLDQRWRLRIDGVHLLCCNRFLRLLPSSRLQVQFTSRGIGLQMDVRGCPGCAIRRILPLSNLTSTPNSKSNCTCGKGPHPEKRSLEPEKHQSGELTAATYPAKPDVSHGQKC